MHNLVVHESNLPKGKGWSPLTWQILEGKNKIPITLFEANSDIDGGNIFKDFIYLQGHELIEEIRIKQALKSFNLILKFLNSNPFPSGKRQKGFQLLFKKKSY